MNRDSITYSLTIILKRIKLIRQKKDKLKLSLDFCNQLPRFEEQINYLIQALNLEPDEEVSKANELLVQKLSDTLQKVNTTLEIGDNRADLEFSNWTWILKMAIEGKFIPEINDYYHKQFDNLEK